MSLCFIQRIEVIFFSRFEESKTILNYISSVNDRPVLSFNFEDEIEDKKVKLEIEIFCAIGNVAQSV